MPKTISHKQKSRKHRSLRTKKYNRIQIGSSNISGAPFYQPITTPIPQKPQHPQKSPKPTTLRWWTTPSSGTRNKTRYENEHENANL